MKKMIAVIMSLVLAMALMTGAVAETVEPETTIIALGETLQLVVEEAQAENAQTVWATSDETVVAVDENGAATALNAGEAVVTATVTTTTIETVEETDAATGAVTAREVEKVDTREITINVAVEIALCPGCGAEYANAEEYAAHVQIAVCETEGHYVCDGQDHETILDEFCRNENPHRVCVAGAATHVCESCGQTYACEDSGSHATCIACGNFWCYKDEGNHATPACGRTHHRACVLDDFNKKDHYRCRHCGDLRCDGDRHGEGKCVAGGFAAPSLPTESAPVEPAPSDAPEL